jgi:hypothetical protein
MQKAFSNVSKFFESYRPYLLAYWENEQINFNLLSDERLINPVESVHALVDRFIRQKHEFEELLPDSREVGMIRVECDQIKKLLVPAPKEYLRELTILLPNIVKGRIDKEKKWLQDQINQIKMPNTKVEHYVKQVKLLDDVDQKYPDHKDRIDLNSSIFNTLLEMEFLDAKSKPKRFLDEAVSLMR